MLLYQNNNWYENKESNAMLCNARTTNGKSKEVKTIEVNERYDLIIILT